MKFLLLDAFYITGRGYVLTCTIEEDGIIKAGDKIGIVGTDEVYEVVAIERSNYLVYPMRPSKNVGILIRGELAQDKRSYSLREIYKVA